MTTETLFWETMVIRVAFGDLVGRVCASDTDAESVPLDEVRAGLDEWGLDRFAGLLLANRVVDTYEAGLNLAMEVRSEWLAKDRRPRTMAQVVTPQQRASIERLFRRMEEDADADAG